jgi:hypothetical protein
MLGGPWKSHGCCSNCTSEGPQNRHAGAVIVVGPHLGQRAERGARAGS